MISETPCDPDKTPTTMNTDVDGERASDKVKVQNPVAPPDTARLPTRGTVDDWLCRMFTTQEDYQNRNRDYLAKELQIQMGYSKLCASMHAANFDIKSARPWPGMRQDPEKRAAYLEALIAKIKDANLELWYCDETRIDAQSKPRPHCEEKVVKTTLPFTGDQIFGNVIVAVCPASGELVYQVVPWVVSEWFGPFLTVLAEFTRQRHREGKKILLVLNNANWHKGKSLPREHIEIMFLPAYSSDYNPIEHIWLVLKTWWFNSNHHCNTHEELAAQVDAGLKSFFDSPQIVRSICGQT